MGRFSDGGGDDAGEPGIDMSSMLDCVFILLIFFIVTTTFVDERGLEVERPTPSAGGDSPKPTVALVVDKAGNVFHEGRKVGPGGCRRAGDGRGARRRRGQGQPGEQELLRRTWASSETPTQAAANRAST
jgi:hypothetical protein